MILTGNSTKPPYKIFFARMFKHPKMLEHLQNKTCAEKHLYF